MSETEVKFGSAPKHSAEVEYRTDVILMEQGDKAIQSTMSDGVTWNFNANSPGVGAFQVGEVVFATSRAVGRPGATRTDEAIFIGGARYFQFAGQWRRSSMTVQQTAELEAENRKNAKNGSCHYVKEEAVNGEAASLYSAHDEAEQAKFDVQMWISKRSGLILKNEIVIDTGDGTSGATRHSIRYEYSKVKAPHAQTTAFRRLCTQCYYLSDANPHFELEFRLRR